MGYEFFKTTADITGPVSAVLDPVAAGYPPMRIPAALTNAANIASNLAVAEIEGRDVGNEFKKQLILYGAGRLIPVSPPETSLMFNKGLESMFE